MFSFVHSVVEQYTISMQSVSMPPSFESGASPDALLEPEPDPSALFEPDISIDGPSSDPLLEPEGPSSDPLFDPDLGSGVIQSPSSSVTSKPFGSGVKQSVSL